MANKNVKKKSPAEPFKAKVHSSKARATTTSQALPGREHTKQKTNKTRLPGVFYTYNLVMNGTTRVIT